LPVLRWIIREGESRLQDLFDRVERGREAIETIAEKGVGRLVGGKGKASKRTLLGEILETPQRGLDALQQQIDTQVRHSVDRLAGHPAVQGELARIQRSLRRLEGQLGRLQRRAGKPTKRAGRTGQ